MIRKFKDSKGNSYPNLFINEETGIFYAVARKGTRIVKKSLQTDSFNEARAKVRDALNEIQSKAPKIGPQRLVREYYEDLQSEMLADGVKPSTMKRMETVWKKSIAPFWGHRSGSFIDDRSVIEFIMWHQTHREGVQLFNVMKYLRSIFSRMEEAKAIDKAPRLRLPRPEIAKSKEKKGRIITEMEMRMILNSADERTQLIAELAWYTGMRLMEIGALRRDQFSDLGGSLVIHLKSTDTKTGRERVVPVPEGLKDRLRARLAGPSAFVFPNRDGTRHLPSQLIDRGWQEAKRQARIKGRMRFHDLRHTCATRMAAQGMNPIVACELLGMSMAVYQKTYLKLTETELSKIAQEHYKRSEL